MQDHKGLGGLKRGRPLQLPQTLRDAAEELVESIDEANPENVLEAGISNLFLHNCIPFMFEPFVRFRAG